MFKRAIVFALIMMCVISLCSFSTVLAQEDTSCENSTVEACQIDLSKHLGKNEISIGFLSEVLWLIVNWWALALKHPIMPTILNILIIYFFFRFILWIYHISKITIKKIRGEIGPFIVEENKECPEFSSQINNLLAKCGGQTSNPCNSAAPNINPGFSEITAALDAISPVKSNVVNLIIPLLRFLLGTASFKQTGYIVTGCVEEKKEEKTFTLCLTLKRIHKAQHLASETFHNSDKQLLIQEAAYWCFWYVCACDKPGSYWSPWAFFPTFESFKNYHQALNAPTFKQAEVYYKKAIKEAPFNALIRLNWGTKAEANNHYLEALENYLEAVLMWPFLYGFWFRIACIFSYFSDWENEWQDNGKQKMICSLIEQLFQTKILTRVFKKNREPKITGVLENLKRDSYFYKKGAFLLLSFYCWEFLGQQVKLNLGLLFEQVILKCLFPFKSGNYSSFLIKHYWGLLPKNQSDEASQFSYSNVISQCCTEIQIRKHFHINEKNSKIEIDNMAIKDNSEKVHKTKDLVRIIGVILESSQKNMDVFYNAACFYALAGMPKESIDNLKKAYRDPKGELSHEWVLNDPDLKSLWGDPEFDALFDIPNKPSLNAYYQEKFILRDQKKQNGFKLIKQILDAKEINYSSMSSSFLLIYATTQVELWTALAQFFSNPDDDETWGNFCHIANPLYFPMNHFFVDEIVEKSKPETKDQESISYLPMFEQIELLFSQLFDYAVKQVSEWKTKKELAASFVNLKEQSQYDTIWTLWKQIEKSQWFYLIELVEKNSIKTDKEIHQGQKV